MMPGSMSYQDRKLALHATAGQVAPEGWLGQVRGWVAGRARRFAVVVGGHHKVLPASEDPLRAGDRPRLLSLAERSRMWCEVHRELVAWSAARYGLADRPLWVRVRSPQTTQVFLSGVVIVAVWIAGNESVLWE